MNDTSTPTLSVPKEIAPGERRVAATPDVVKKYVGDGIAVVVEAGAGESASFADESYVAAGAEVVGTAAEVFERGDVVAKVRKPLAGGPNGENEIELLRAGQTLIGMLEPLTDTELKVQLQERGVVAFALEAIPRITRAQSMDVLSSQATVAGYKAVLIAASSMGKLLPMLTTAAGTIRPAKALILGAGVAGLQAIATARRLGARVEAFDLRPAVKEQVESLGAVFVEFDVGQDDAETADGYAKELTPEQRAKQQELLAEAMPSYDFVITTASVPGRRAPVLITARTVGGMSRGSEIVDLAAETGGNCELTEPGRTVEHGGVKIHGPLNVPSSVPINASQLYSKNVQSFLYNLLEDGRLKIDLSDEIVAATCLTPEALPTEAAGATAVGSSREGQDL